MTESEERLKISGRPEVVFKGPEGEVTVEAKADTGADRTTIDPTIASKIGAGPIQKVVQVNGAERRCVVPVVVEIEGRQLAINASISDRRGPNYAEGQRKKSTDALLGEAVLKQFGVYLGMDS
ncbi:aspartyl protease family protein [Halorarius litoreus]|uniref:aspartyl protease family protein n=1 Tax=Halorarius litoreus TaxID=2962676 RepID=UPI0020CC0056|nr:aspartyl protease family protein [Halorarius litoreus]